MEVSTDAGKTWSPAKLQDPVLSKAHTVFCYLWNWNGDETQILSRAADETGYIQPTLQQLVNARGKDMGGYHLNPITSRVIKNNGQVLFKPEKWK